MAREDGEENCKERVVKFGQSNKKWIKLRSNKNNYTI